VPVKLAELVTLKHTQKAIAFWSNLSIWSPDSHSFHPHKDSFTNPVLIKSNGW
jgi:hypothetical protein